MAKSYREFKKELEMKKAQAETLRMLNSAVSTLSKKRDSYIEQAKTAKRLGNESQYRAMIALLKNAMMNLAQAQDMVANFTIAKDMCEMQQLNKKFLKSLDSVMKNVYKTCKAINVSSSEKTFSKALYQQNITSQQLRQVLRDNNAAFSSSVDSVSDMTDEEITGLLNDGINDETEKINNSLDALELEFSAPTALHDSSVKTVEKMIDGGVSAPGTPVQNTYKNISGQENKRNSAFSNRSSENFAGYDPIENTNGYNSAGSAAPINGNPSPSLQNSITESTKKTKASEIIKEKSPEDKVLGTNEEETHGVFSEYKFNWENLPSTARRQNSLSAKEKSIPLWPRNVKKRPRDRLPPETEQAVTEV